MTETDSGATVSDNPDAGFADLKKGDKVGFQDLDGTTAVYTITATDTAEDTGTTTLTLGEA